MRSTILVLDKGRTHTRPLIRKITRVDQERYRSPSKGLSYMTSNKSISKFPLETSRDFKKEIRLERRYQGTDCLRSMKVEGSKGRNRGIESFC